MNLNVPALVKNKTIQKYLVAGSIFLGLIFISFVLFNKEDTVIAEHTVERETLQNSVRVFGNAEPETVFTLSFEIGGRLISLPYEVGDPVVRGWRLAALDSTDIQANINKAVAQVNVEKSVLSEISAPDSPEAIQIQLAEIQKQNQVVADATQALFDDISVAQTSYEDILDDHLDREYFRPNNPEETQLRLGDVEDMSDELRAQLTTDRVNLFYALDSFEEVDNVGKTYSNFIDLLESTQSLYTDLIAVLEQESGVAPAQLASDFQDDSDALDDLAITLTPSFTAFNSAEGALQVLEKELELQQSGASDEAKDVQQKIISSRQQEVNALYSDLTKYRILSPISGRVFQTFVDLYENVSPNSQVISIVKDGALVVRADVAESDVVYVGIGNQVEITFDAIPNQAFLGTVSFVEQAVSNSSSAPTYETTFVFDEDQDITPIKSGMTANITAYSGAIDDVVTLPVNFVYSKDTETYVLVRNAEGTIIEKPITIGFRTNTGMVEITSGLQEGEVVLITQ